MTESRDRWSGRLGFTLATIGSAVGLGSIWKFPYEVGANGGGGFVLFYLLGLALIVAPLMLAEFAIGRRGGSDARASIAAVAAELGAARGWSAVGTLGVVVAFLILSFYSVIGGWALAYAVETAWGGLAAADAAAAATRFEALLAAPGRMAAYHTAFMLATAWIVARGIARGIEAAVKVLMPLLALLMVALAAYAMIAGDVAATLRYLFAFDPALLTAEVVIDALGLGFFSIGVGMAIMITYAAYLGPGVDLATATVATIACDTAISFAAGLAIFPIVFAHGLDPASGPGLMFITLPVAFGTIPGGGLVALAFFALLVIAALASAISLLEMPVAFAVKSLGWSRRRGVVLAGGAIWLMGFATILSFNLWMDWHPLAALPPFATATLFDLIDYLTSNLMLPLGGLLLALFTGWALPARFLEGELTLGPRARALLRFALRYVAPAGIVAATTFPFLPK